MNDQNDDYIYDESGKKIGHHLSPSFAEDDSVYFRQIRDEDNVLTEEDVDYKFVCLGSNGEFIFAANSLSAVQTQTQIMELNLFYLN